MRHCVFESRLPCARECNEHVEWNPDSVRNPEPRTLPSIYLLCIPRMLTKNPDSTVWQPNATRVAPGMTQRIVCA